MKISARVIHGGTVSTFNSSHDLPTAQFFAAKQYEWVSGRRHGSFESHASNGIMVVQFAEITEFSVEVSF